MSPLSPCCLDPHHRTGFDKREDIAEQSATLPWQVGHNGKHFGGGWRIKVGQFLLVPLSLSRKSSDILKAAAIQLHDLKDQFMHYIFTSLSYLAVDRGELLQESLPMSCVFLDFWAAHSSILARTTVCPIFIVSCLVLKAFTCSYFFIFLKIEQWQHTLVLQHFTLSGNVFLRGLMP